MLKRSLCSFVVAALAVSAFGQSQGSANPFGTSAAKDVFQKYVNNFTKAKVLHATFLYQWVGQGERTGTVDLTKPGVGTIRTPDYEITFDGSEVKVLDTAKGTTKTLPQDDKSMAKMFKNPELAVWYSFFNPGAFLDCYSIDSDGFKTRRDETMRVMAIARDHPVPQGERTYHFYLDPQSEILRQIEYKEVTPKKRLTFVLVIKDLKFQN